MPRLRDLDSIYFDDASWQSRLQDWVKARAGDDTFVNANSLAVEVISRRRDLGLRMAVNIAAHALLLFLRDRRYLNASTRTSSALDVRQYRTLLWPPADAEVMYSPPAISGDTAPSDNIVKLARGADVLVHSAMYWPAIDKAGEPHPNAASLKSSILAHQTSAEDAELRRLRASRRSSSHISCLRTIPR